MRLRTVAMAASLLLVTTGVVVIAHGDPARAAEPPSVAVWIKSHFNQRCLDADLTGGGGNGNKVHLWDCNISNNGRHQKWRFVPVPGRYGWYHVVNERFGRCLNADNSGGSFPNGAKVQLWDCDPSWLDANAIWTLTGPGDKFDLSPLANTTYVIDVDISGPDRYNNGVRAQMWPWIPNATNQLWDWV
ncbi:hypothetical protein GCM10009557_06940 [Virgisporangium ochraceum]|uniref:Ricin B lectin domain-containing protein n=1 Tax=Virgisporangium ochraceum TaxID=65505 RepID=A0A8J4A2Q2_9ACTN|nr:RICIN domain-containing protein [Virgisporangium ochraceum]GIJ72765.1 hypothetical protein Voc01_076820 [Virgisporangium ochraceum]